MTTMKKYVIAAVLFLMGMTSIEAQVKLEYSTKPTDMIQMKSFTLSNGMHVYVHENHDTPRILTNVVVRAGSMNEPSDCTGLAHYMEHLFFNGTTKIGTLNYAAEKPLLDEIEELFEQYRSTTDESARKAIYSRIDSLSYEASKYTVMNEYNSILTEIGATEVNAFTDDKTTSFVASLPNNEVERWAKLQAHMFSDFVIRGFHTELEAVYEEFNMNMHDDAQDAWEANNRMIFPECFNPVKVIGTQHDLKNPSIREVYNFYHKYYVPENMAICMSGDFDTDEVLPILDSTFGQIKASGSVPEFPVVDEVQPGTQGYTYDVVGTGVPITIVSWRLPKPTNERSQSIIRYINDLLCNEEVGIMHNELELGGYVQKVEGGSDHYRDFTNYSLIVTPNADSDPQSGLFYAMYVVDSLAYGDWDASLLDGIRREVKRTWLGLSKNNEAIVASFVDDFSIFRHWSSVEEDDSLFADISKEEIQEYMRKWFCDENMRVVYKQQGENTNVESFTKPDITPLFDNGKKYSELGQQILSEKSTMKEPEYHDFTADISEHLLPDGNKLLYLKNTDDELYNLSTYYDVSERNIRLLENVYAITSLAPADEPIQAKRFRLGFDQTSLDVENGFTSNGFSGLNETFKEALEAAMDNNKDFSSVTDEKYQDTYEQILGYREQVSATRDYQVAVLLQNGIYGKNNVVTNQLTRKDYMKHKPQDFLDAYISLNDYQHTFAYYGPEPVDSVIAVLTPYLNVGTAPKVADSPAFLPQKVTKNEVIVQPFAGDNTSIFLYSCDGSEYKVEEDHLLTLFENYYAGLSGPLLNEMRGKRSLCYSASVNIDEEIIAHTPYYILGSVDCQCDKLIDAIKTFRYVIDEMPLSREHFEKVKEARLQELLTIRHPREEGLAVMWSMHKFDFNENPEMYEYEHLKNTTFEDFEAFYNKTFRNRKYRIMILGNITDEQRAYLKTLGKLKELK